MRTQSVILNVIPSGVNPVVHLSQYDQEDDGALLFNIYDGNVLADLTGCTATIEGTKPDGTFYMYPCTVYSTYLTSAVYFQMTSIAGSYPAEVRINRGGENVGTINLTMMVEPAGVGRVDVSDTEVPSLLDDIETSVDEAEYWAHVAEQAVTGVVSWNGRTGAVLPVAGDYNASQVDYDNSNSGLTSNRAQGAIDELAPKKIITSDDAFDPTKTYAIGDWLIYQGVLYEVITACTGVTPPNATYYNPITLHDLQSRISNIFKTGPTTATDFNDIIDTGVYWINLSTTSGNKPTTVPYGVLEVFQSYDGHPLQRFTVYNTDVISFKTYVRMYVNTSWSNWVLYSSESDVSTPTITSGISNFTITSSYAYRQGNHIHAEVYGTYGTNATTGTQVPFFTISGINAPSALRTVGTVIIMDSSLKPIIMAPALARLGTNKCIYQHATSVLTSGWKIGFIVDYVENW